MCILKKEKGIKGEGGLKREEGRGIPVAAHSGARFSYSYEYCRNVWTIIARRGSFVCTSKWARDIPPTHLLSVKALRDRQRQPSLQLPHAFRISEPIRAKREPSGTFLGCIQP